ncbi:hypothetical protein JYK00_05865 [Thermosipho ferrireducens]|uniref:Uncharacterized protein n=1 Tax=Thermosipho ferrireducens TaxID=2571116 RepID=A0ABX7S4A8_9BACT|nr:hypothetical protein [Thermosipho ferrireducens]QTA37269.1 hypothetical protein JYK00_05865 [Thermosipho ferrireducens]
MKASVKMIFVLYMNFLVIITYGNLTVLNESVTFFEKSETSVLLLTEYNQSPPNILRECNESITEPLKQCICTEKRYIPGHMDTTCMAHCTTGCEIARIKGKIAYYACIASCHVACWVPGNYQCFKIECKTIYPCNSNN